MKKMQNILLDLGGVILDVDYNLSKVAFESMGITNFDEMYSQADADWLFKDLETGRISKHDFFKEINDRTSLSLSDKQIVDAWNAMLGEFRESTLSFLDDLKHRCNLYLFSNTNFIHMEAFFEIYHRKPRPHPFNDYFKVPYYSCEIGLRKPDAMSYQWILNHLNLEPNEIIFVDDSIQNVEAAKQIGMETVHLKKGMTVEELGF